MKLSYNWLKDYLESDLTPQQIADAMTAIGIEVDGVEEQEEIPGGLAGVVVAEVLECEAHPDSDHLHITKVDDGTGEPLTVVCGAPNVAAGQKVLFARIGAVLPGDFKIKKGKLRGQVSMGMNCSSKELGLGDNGVDGLMILPEDAPVGMDFAQYWGLSDRILDLEITPNRPDCLSMEGMAREVGAMYRVPVADVTAGVELVEDDQPASDLCTVQIADPELCPRYTARVIRNVKVGPRPEGLAERISAAGARPINNVVDITNYVLFLLGQPLHAFD